MGQPEARGSRGLGGGREGEHLSVKMKSPSLRTGIFRSILILENSLVWSCPMEKEVKKSLQSKTHTCCALPSPFPSRTPRPGWAKK